MADYSAPQPAPTRCRFARPGGQACRLPVIALLLLALIFTALIINWRRLVYSPAPRTFEGASDKLQRTVIVPTLDTPIESGKNVIWCSSFQVAWNKLKNDIIKEPIKLTNAQTIADRLNNARESEADLPAGSYYSAAGWVKDGIGQTIQQEMAKRFPNVPQPTFDLPEKVAIAYAYLAVNLSFDPPFIDNPKRLVFKDSRDRTQGVRSFGIPPESYMAGEKLKGRVKVLYALAGWPSGRHDEFVIDPNNDSQPNQIVLALVAPKATLAETLADVETKIAQWKPPPGYYPIEKLLIPNTSYKIDHHFSDLEGADKTFQNKSGAGLYIGEAFQMIDFSLSRTGVTLKSEAKLVAKSASVPEPMVSDFIFDRPFLLYMKKRGAEHPFFVMWVDNPELLTKW